MAYLARLESVARATVQGFESLRLRVIKPPNPSGDGEGGQIKLGNQFEKDRLVTAVTTKAKTRYPINFFLTDQSPPDPWACALYSFTRGVVCVLRHSD